MKTRPEKVVESGTFAFFQEKTVKFGQSETDGKLHEVCKISAYQDCAYITFEMAGIKMCFEVSERSAEYLNAYFNR